MTARLKLRRADGRVYLDRRGIEHQRIGGIFLHHMTAPDPGMDLHDHPWSFVSIVLAGGYSERRADFGQRNFSWNTRKRWSIKRMRLHEFHRIVDLRGCGSTWTLVLHGPRRQEWGFATPTGYVDSEEYHGSARGLERGLGADQ